MNNPSLSAFCKARNLPKSTVYKFLKAENFDTSNGLSQEAIAAIESYFGAEPEPEPAPLTIVEGNHSTAIETPTYEGLTVDLAQFRDSEALVIDDPLAVAAQFLQVADQVQNALQADLQARQARLNQTRQAQDAIAAKAQELQLEQRLYKLQAAQVDQAQTLETQALAANLAALQALGKPSAGDGASPVE